MSTPPQRPTMVVASFAVMLGDQWIGNIVDRNIPRYWTDTDCYQAVSIATGVESQMCDTLGQAEQWLVDQWNAVHPNTETVPS